MDGSIDVHSEIFSFLSVYIGKARTQVCGCAHTIWKIRFDFKNVSNQGRKVSGPCYEETVMKTPKKVIEKISLPLKFVTFVMAVLMFAVSPVSAAPDCDNPKHQDKPACTGGDGEGSISYTAQLTGGFRVWAWA